MWRRVGFLVDGSCKGGGVLASSWMDRVRVE